MFNEVYTEDGRKYFVNPITKQTYWELPKDVRAVCIKSSNSPNFKPYDSMPAISRTPEHKPRPTTPFVRAQ